MNQNLNHISICADDVEIDINHTQEFLSSCFDHLKNNHPILQKPYTVSIVFTDDSEIQRLNRDYRGKDKATDVLSFSQLEGEPIVTNEVVSLGDIIISIDTARRQCLDFSATLNEEIARLLAHGLLHLLGYDHENVSAKKAEEMFSLQDHLLSVIDRGEFLAE